MEKTENVLENHGAFCNLKSTNPEYYNNSSKKIFHSSAVAIINYISLY